MYTARDSFLLPDSAATEALGARLARQSGPGDTLCLWGGLGAGKTTLARGAIQAWTGHAEEEAPSPTYTLVQTYEGPKGELWHMDLFRLKRPEEALELDLEDALVNAFCIIEWPERLGAHLPRSRLDISLEQEGAMRRAFVRAHGAHAGRNLAF